MYSFGSNNINWFDCQRFRLCPNLSYPFIQDGKNCPRQTPEIGHLLPKTRLQKKVVNTSIFFHHLLLIQIYIVFVFFVEILVAGIQNGLRSSNKGPKNYTNIYSILETCRYYFHWSPYFFILLVIGIRGKKSNFLTKSSIFFFSSEIS